MNILKILFPTDFSESSEAALGYASTLAAETGAKLIIAHVFNATPLYLTGYTGVSMATMPDYAQDVERENRRLLEQVQPTKDGVQVEHRFLEGSPEQEIVSLADREQVDLIVMGTHGRSGLSRLLMGSIAEGVLRHAKCPVLTVKQPMPQASTEGDEGDRQSAGQKGPSIRSKLSLH
ncbi:MAG: universal stress protein [Lacipirellulaceae bacterium]